MRGKYRVSGGDALARCRAFLLVKRGGQKEMQLPEGPTQPRRIDRTLVKALARAFRRKRMLESGDFAIFAECEGIAF